MDLYQYIILIHLECQIINTSDVVISDQIIVS